MQPSNTKQDIFHHTVWKIHKIKNSDAILMWYSRSTLYYLQNVITDSSVDVT